MLTALLGLALLAPPDDKLAGIDAAVAGAIERGEVPGAVVVVVRDGKTVYRKAFGLRAKVPADVPMTIDTVFDLASLTKPLATATSVMLLAERAQLRLADPVAKYWPAFAANGKADVTLEHCLLHTSGLTPDNAIADYKDGRAAALDKVAGLKLEAPPGTRFKYSDVGFIALGAVVEKVAGKPLDEFAAENVFKPLGMADTGYLPKDPARVAPTGLRGGAIILGTVHDPRAFAMAGVAGHAGLFGTADDLAKYSIALLGGKSVLSPPTVKLFTDPVRVSGGLRSRGWDVDTSFTAQRGDLFPASDGFGHTGFTGTSLWIDPPSKTAIIILTNRVHPNDKGNATPLRRQIGTIVAAATPTIGARKPQPQSSPTAAVLCGIDVLAQEKFQRLAGKRVGLVTNHTGRTADGTSTIDALAAAPGVKLVALFSPEHGIRGEKDEKIGDGVDAKTGLPVFSLYGDRRKPTPEQLKDVDVIVFDIQDIGCRFYTYISTLGLILEAGAEQKKPVLVLDRPNPLGGLAVRGPVRDDGRASFIGFHELPVQHGLTVGEMAQLFKAERKIDVTLEIVPVKNWRRGDAWDRTGLIWVNPSPNMRSLYAAMLYPGVGLLEYTNLSVGRGTDRPFEWVGGPWVDGRNLAAEFNRRNVPGVRAVPASRTPNASMHKDKPCGGIDFVLSDVATVDGVRVGLELAAALRATHAGAWDVKKFDNLLLHKATADALLAGKGYMELEAAWAPALDAFKARRRGVLLYPE